MLSIGQICSTSPVMASSQRHGSWVHLWPLDPFGCEDAVMVMSPYEWKFLEWIGRKIPDKQISFGFIDTRDCMLLNFPLEMFSLTLKRRHYLYTYEGLQIIITCSMDIWARNIYFFSVPNLLGLYQHEIMSLSWNEKFDIKYQFKA